MSAYSSQSSPLAHAETADHDWLASRPSPRYLVDFHDVHSAPPSCVMPKQDGRDKNSKFSVLADTRNLVDASLDVVMIYLQLRTKGGNDVVCWSSRSGMAGRIDNERWQKTIASEMRV